jgi:hypothetical protein
MPEIGFILVLRDFQPILKENFWSIKLIFYGVF